MESWKKKKKPQKTAYLQKRIELRTCCERKKKHKQINSSKGKCSWSLFCLFRCLDVKPKKKNHLLASHIVFILPMWNNVSGKEQR